MRTALLVMLMLTPSLVFSTGRFFNPSWDTVSDLGTGLLWQARDDGERYTYFGAIDFCDALNLNGRGGWRLPHVKELATLVDESSYNPSVYPYFKTQSHAYWTRTPLALPKDDRFYWTVNFSDGHMHPFRSDTGYFVRCVRKSDANLQGVNAR